MKPRISFLLTLALVFLFSAVAFVPDAQAVQIKRIVRGIANFDTDDVAQEATLKDSAGNTVTVDTTKSIILTSSIGEQTNTTNGFDQNQNFTADFAGDDTISIDRGGGNRTGSCIWQVVEFADGVTVQRGLAVVNSSTKLKSITIGGITTSKSVPIIMTRGGFNSTNLPIRYSSILPFRIPPTYSWIGRTAAPGKWFPSCGRWSNLIPTRPCRPGR